MFHRGLLLFLLLVFYSTIYGQTKADSISIKLKQYISKKAEKDGFSGNVLIIEKGKTLLRMSFGKADTALNIPVSFETKYPVFSITKMFTAAGILQLEERGKLKISDKISKYFPTFQEGDEITIEMLLSHSSGLKKGWFITEEEELKYHKRQLSEDTVRKLISLEIDFNKKNLSKDSIVQIIKGSGLLFKPGTDFNYSNLGYILLGYIIERSSGLSFKDYITTNLLKPLDMNNSGVLIQNGANPPLTNSYYHSLYGNKLISSDSVNWNMISSDGNIYSTSDDLYKWGKGLTGDKILSKASKKKMFTKRNADYGYGVGLHQLFGYKTVNHDGGYLGLDNVIVMFPDKDLFFLVFKNKEIDVSAGKIMYNLAEIILKK
ncbi:MAG: serine hydrolase domain-containing protein [Bacteroidia bacterium]